ncbi:hypothetical protein GOBAR_DD27970 [Gossypium barbadense]|nr:hypothetical protein GOBAR_DD27970 [Gossypium barbadense]
MTINLVEGVNPVLLKTRHLSIVSVFSATFYRFATLMPRMCQQQVDQMEAGHVFVEDVRDAIVVNCLMARSMNVEIYSRRLETFRVTETIDRRPSIPLRSYGANLRNRRCKCRRFETLHCPCVEPQLYERTLLKSANRVWVSGRHLSTSADIKLYGKSNVQINAVDPNPACSK